MAVAPWLFDDLLLDLADHLLALDVSDLNAVGLE